MPVSENLACGTSCNVEVSGWDEDEVFFVEKSELATGPETTKHISLEHMLPDRAIIFVRILHQPSLQRAATIAYEAEFVGCDSKGYHRFRLNIVQPRHHHRYPVN